MSIFLIAAIALAGLEIKSSVLSGGGGLISEGSYELAFSVGQPVVGEVGDSGLNLCSGFWCGSSMHTAYLPLVIK